MILNDEKIKEYLKSGKIIITPGPKNIQIQPASVDLRLSDELVVMKTSPLPYDTANNDKNTTSTEDMYHTRKFSNDDPLILKPREFVLTQTLEYVEIPDDLLGRVEGRSSLGRLGVAVHITAGFIDPGFKGNITLEMVNLGHVPIVLYPNQRVCQIVFEELNAPAKVPYGVRGRNKYQGQKSPQPSRIFEDIN